MLLPPMVAAQTAVHFQAKATVSGPKVTLADIAAITPAGQEATRIGLLPVASAPAPGKTKELSTVSVISALRNRPEVAGVDWQGSPTIVVERAGQTIGQAELQAMIEGFLVENSAKLPKAEVRLTGMRAPETLTLPAGRLSWQVTPSRPGIIGSTSFNVALLVDGKPASTCVVRGRLEAIAEVATATTTLHRGDALTEADIVMERQDIGAIDHPFFSSDELLGMQVARMVTPGTVLRRDHIVLPPVIKDGEMVRLLAQRGPMQLFTNGLARGDGRLGETIAVKNIASNRIVHGRVDGPGVVTVEF